MVKTYPMVCHHRVCILEWTAIRSPILHIFHPLQGCPRWLLLEWDTSHLHMMGNRFLLLPPFQTSPSFLLLLPFLLSPLVSLIQECHLLGNSWVKWGCLCLLLSFQFLSLSLLLPYLPKFPTRLAKLGNQFSPLIIQGRMIR